MSELDVLRHAWRGVRATFTAQAPEARTYAATNFIGAFGLILLVGIPADMFVRHLFLQRYFWIGIAIDVLEVYAAVWIFGLFGTMVARPHRLEGKRVLLRRGCLGEVEFARDTIEWARPAADSNGRRLQRQHAKAALLLVPGTGAVELRLREPVMYASVPAGRRRCVDHIFVASDRTAHLCALLTPQADSPAANGKASRAQ